TFTFEGLEFPTKLVDLPTIIEAQKTLNGKQMYKIADISQMLVVDPTPVEKPTVIKTEPSTATGPSSGGANSQVDATTTSMPAPTLPPLKHSDYVWPDGLTNPLKNVRKRRFRKRVSKVAVEGVENEIERLLQEDALAEEVVYEIREQIDGMDRFDSDEGATPAPEGVHSDMDMDGEMMDMDEEEEEEDEDEDDLLAELERKIEGGDGNSTDDEGEGDEDGGTPQPQIKANTSAQGVGANFAGSGLNVSNVKTGPANANAGIGLGATGVSGGHLGSTSGALSGAAGRASSAIKQGSKGKGQTGDEDEDEDEDDEEEDEEEEEDDDDDDSGSEEDEDEDEDDKDDKESAQMEKLLKDEIKELNGKVKDNEEKLQSAPNDILKRRFGSILDNLRKELELKTMQLEEVKERAKSKAKAK
ncbi:hypothetical protein BGZ54_000493, partial [Gamsiella multidivaricata]